MEDTYVIITSRGEVFKEFEKDKLSAVNIKANKEFEKDKLSAVNIKANKEFEKDKLSAVNIKATQFNEY